MQSGGISKSRGPISDLCSHVLVDNTMYWVTSALSRAQRVLKPVEKTRGTRISKGEAGGCQKVELEVTETFEQMRKKMKLIIMNFVIHLSSE